MRAIRWKRVKYSPPWLSYIPAWASSEQWSNPTILSACSHPPYHLWMANIAACHSLTKIIFQATKSNLQTNCKIHQTHKWHLSFHFIGQPKNITDFIAKTFHETLHTSNWPSLNPTNKNSKYTSNMALASLLENFPIVNCWENWDNSLGKLGKGPSDASHPTPDHSHLYFYLYL